MDPIVFGPKKGSTVMRPMLPKEKDDYTVKWWKSFSASYITLPVYGGAIIGFSCLFEKLFDELFRFANTFYLSVSPETIGMIHTGKTIGLILGGIMVVVGIFNLIFNRDDDDD